MRWQGRAVRTLQEKQDGDTLFLEAGIHLVERITNKHVGGSISQLACGRAQKRGHAGEHLEVFASQHMVY